MLPDYSNISATAESLYREKYIWLLRWARHFCGKDRSAAEDLVQDVFMQMLVSWPTVAAAEEPEKLLYTYLKYAFLLKCRRDRRYSFQALSAIDFESVQLSLARQGDADPIELQDGLRRILLYLNWRKIHAKCASVLLLRFFHGFFPSEIMQIARQTRRSVDTGLALAREETKAYLADPKKLSFMHRGTPPAGVPSGTALPPDELVSALRAAVFEDCPGYCLPEALLRQRYIGKHLPPIECHLLAHIVSCARCLDLVCGWCKFTSSKDRSPEEAWGFSRREKPSLPSLATSSARAMQRSIDGGEQRYRVAYEHRPKALLIAVDGQLLAARDVSSFSSELKIEMTTGDPKELIEVMSEQELPLLTLPIASVAGQRATFLREEAKLAGGQSIILTIRFIAKGTQIELYYLDPLFDHAPAALALQEDPGTASPRAVIPVASFWSRAVAKLGGPMSRGRSLFHAVSHHPYSLATVTLLLALCLFGTMRLWRKPSLSADSILADAVKEQRPQAGGSEGVVTQQLRITTSRGSITRVLHHDLRGRRRPVAAAVTESQKTYAGRLAMADISWDDPLSSANFRYWHDHATNVKDDVHDTGNGEITLTSHVQDPYLVSESLTIRALDSHTISRSVEFRDHEQIQIAEVDFHIVPWSKADPQWFEAGSALAMSPPSQPLRIRSLAKSVPLTDFQLDEAELEVRFGLSEIGADANERLQLSRKPDGIRVEGLVADEARKQQIVSRLKSAQHAVVLIRTFAEFEQQSKSSIAPLSLTVSEQDTGSSALERLIASRAGTAQEAGGIAHALFTSNTSAQQAVRMLDDLDQRFLAHALTDDAASLLHQLRRKQLDRLNDAIAKQVVILASIGIQLPDTIASASEDKLDLRAQSARSTQLCTELISQTAQPGREAGAILADLASSLSILKSTAEQNGAEEAQGNHLPSPLSPTGHDH